MKRPAPSQLENPRLTTQPNTVVAAFDLRNTSSEPWRGDDGFQIGFHLFDPETGMFLEEGGRIPLDLQPDEERAFSLAVTLPPEPGEYRAIVSPLREHHAWMYEKGWPFLLLDVTVLAGGEVRVNRALVTTKRLLQRESARRSVLRIFTLPVTSVWKNRSLIRSMVRRDILGRYRGSFGGGFWTILNPLLLMLTYFFVFGLVLKTRFRSDPSPAGFALYFLAGMLPWLAFSDAVGRAPFVLLEHRNFVKKLLFPIETLPVNLVVAGLVSEAFGLALFALGFLLVRGLVPVTVLWLPVLIVPQMLFTAGVCWFLAALGVFVRDLGQVNGFVLTLWFFITPICYDESSLPRAAGSLLTLNPLYTLVRGYRAVFLEGHAPALNSTVRLWLIAVTVFLLGYAWFHKLRKTFADTI